MKYIFPAIITHTKDDENFPNGVYEVSFPDLTGCLTFGETIEEAFINAKDALNGMLWTLEDDEEKTIPKASDFKTIKCDNKNSVVRLIEADTLEYRKNLKVPFDHFYSESNLNALTHSINQIKNGQVITKTMKELETMEK